MKKQILNTALLKDYLTFSRGEQRGVFVLLSLIFLLIIFYQIMPLIILKEKYDLSGSEKEIREFEELLRIADSADESGKAGKFKKDYQQKFYTASFDSSKWKKKEDNFIIELNSADTMDLQRLRGIGPGFAKRIIKYRDRLGGFYEVSQVIEVFGMDEERYKGIKDHLAVNSQMVKPLKINQVTFKEMLAHPYFPFEITKALMIYRKDHKKIKDVNELTAIPLINDSVFRKMKPYVDVE